MSEVTERSLSDEKQTPYETRTGHPPAPVGKGTGALVVVAVVALLVGVGGGFLVGHATVNSPSPAPKAATPVDYVYLQIKPGCAWCASPFNGSDEYTPANFTVPAHTLIVLTITNFDNGVNPVAPSVRQVSGVLGNVEYQGASAPSSWGTTASSVDGSALSHTFSANPQSTTSGFNVPIPASTGPGGNSVTVMMFFNTTGSISWQCNAPCDGWSMAQAGFMAGTITVV
ncbi:MAG: hypothetical protein KGJ23_09760 [Euryarchaeota archaeon]|nr:hypothetical protein [Euryarchaeota archaeon]MDE1836888.1 hypothetical protein [Euryarchaeota archaeon]MDE1881350.1 hypothetical protein [Euryarchaeota archaeon]MDE2045291.1 hypothetical protein [Thermoplasmata archaeon]